MTDTPTPAPVDLTPEEKAWATPFRRCMARKYRATGDIYWGRCELRRDHPGDHELERGLIPVTWPNDGKTR